MSRPREKSPPFWPGARNKVPQQGMTSATVPAMGSSSARKDNVIMGTDDDAIISRLSAVELGYLEDPFVKHFVRRPSRRPPLINRGSYLRTSALDNLVEKFIKSTGSTSESDYPSGSLPIKKQIVSLGCGSDSRYFNLKRKGLAVHKYFEIDFQESTAKKALIIKKNKLFSDIVGDPNMKVGLGGTEIYANDYCLLSGDLREFVETIVPKLKANGFDTGLPTLFLSECVLIYVEPRDSDSIVEWVGTNTAASLFVVYEQINPTDAFGSMMLRNLRAREIELPGIHAYPTLKSQEERFLSRGWTAAKAVSMNTLLGSLPDEEMKRISKLEIFDEIEEWQLLAEHYCVAWAYVANESLSNSGNDTDQASFIKLLSSSVE